MDTWEIKMCHKMTLWGVITRKIECMVARYSTMIDNAKTMADKLAIEREFVVTMYTYGVICDSTNNAKLVAKLVG